MNFTEGKLSAVTKLYEFWVGTYYEGPLLKFEYKTGQDPTIVAQQFIDNNGLQQSSLRKIVNHLLENIPEENQYNNIDEPIILLSSNGSFFIIYTVAVVILVISLVVGWKLPDLIAGNSEARGSYRENDSDEKLSYVKPRKRFLPKVMTRKLNKNKKDEQEYYSAEMSGSFSGTFNDSMYQEEVYKAKEKCDNAVGEAEQQFKQDSEMLDKKFAHYKAKKSYNRAKKEADDKFNEDFKVAEEKRTKGMKMAKKKFTFRKKKINEGDLNKTKEEELNTIEYNKIKKEPKTILNSKIKEEQKNIDNNEIKEEPNFFEYNKIKEEPNFFEYNRIKEQPKTIDNNKIIDEVKIVVDDKILDKRAEVSSNDQNKVDNLEINHEKKGARNVLSFFQIFKKKSTTLQQNESTTLLKIQVNNSTTHQESNSESKTQNAN